MKNKKYFGKLQRHRIQQRAAGNKIQEIGDTSSTTTTTGKDEKKKTRPLVTEVKSTTRQSSTAPKNDDIKRRSFDPARQQECPPQYKLFKVPANSETPHTLRVEILVPGVKSKREITLDLGEDRIVFEARKAGYLLDIFLPFNVDLNANESLQAQFSAAEERLNMSVPLST